MRLAGFQFSDLSFEGIDSPFQVGEGVKERRCERCGKRPPAHGPVRQIGRPNNGIDLYTVVDGGGMFVVRRSAAERCGIGRSVVPVSEDHEFGYLEPKRTVPMLRTDTYPRVLGVQCGRCGTAEVAGVRPLFVRSVVGDGLAVLDHPVWDYVPIVMTGEATAREVSSMRASPELVLRGVYMLGENDDTAEPVEAMRHDRLDLETLRFASPGG